MTTSISEYNRYHADSERSEAAQRGAATRYRRDAKLSLLWHVLVGELGHAPTTEEQYARAMNDPMYEELIGTRLHHHRKGETDD